MIADHARQTAVTVGITVAFARSRLQPNAWVTLVYRRSPWIKKAILEYACLISAEVVMIGECGTMADTLPVWFDTCTRLVE